MPARGVPGPGSCERGRVPGPQGWGGRRIYSPTPLHPIYHTFPRKKPRVVGLQRFRVWGKVGFLKEDEDDDEDGNEGMDREKGKEMSKRLARMYIIVRRHGDRME